ncbi:MAG: GldG family protein [Clostridia bacterium]|nr:GldG family protein [Clostridia bacterium]
MNKLFNDKRLKYGTYSVVVTIIFVAILIVINLIIGQFNKSFDFTKAEIFSLSDETKSVLDNVRSDINIYTLFRTGGSEAIIGRVNQIIDKYEQASRRINAENRDLYLHPDFAKKYASEDVSVNINSIIVESGDKFKVINYEDYYNDEGILNLESALTSALQYVNMEISPAVYFVTGHGEPDVSNFTSLNERLKLANYTANTLNLISSEIPADCTALVITPVDRDYSKAETEKILNYLSADGRAFMLLGGVDMSKCPNLMSIASTYGVTLDDGYVYEGAETSYMMYPYAVLPSLKEHDINSSLILKDYHTLAVACQSVKNTEFQKQGLVTEPLLSTSAKSYIKARGNESANKEAGDKEGPFNLAVAVTDSTYTDKEHKTKLVVSGCSYYLIDPNTDSMVNGANSTFVVNALNWLNDSTDSIYIAPKNLTGSSIVADAGSAAKIKIISWLVIPGILFGLGFAVWITRRNK